MSGTITTLLIAGLVLAPVAEGQTEGDRGWAIENQIRFICSDGGKMPLAFLNVKGTNELNVATISYVPEGKKLEDMERRYFLNMESKTAPRPAAPQVMQTELVGDGGNRDLETGQGDKSEHLKIDIMTLDGQMGTPVYVKWARNGEVYDLKCDWIANSGDKK